MLVVSTMFMWITLLCKWITSGFPSSFAYPPFSVHVFSAHTSNLLSEICEDQWYGSPISAYCTLWMQRNCTCDMCSGMPPGALNNFSTVGLVVFVSWNILMTKVQSPTCSWKFVCLVILSTSDHTCDNSGAFDQHASCNCFNGLTALQTITS